MSETILEVRGLRRVYVTGGRSLEVLRGVDLTVKGGEMVGLVGPSGSGKSSLLHAAGLLEQPTAGAILIEGADCSKLSERERTRIRLGTIGFVYQFHHLLPELSALENVALPAMIGGETRSSARERARARGVYLGRGVPLRHQPAQLSGGEQQRVAVARALANAPRLLLADEPTGNLDPATSRAVFTTLKKVVRQSGVGALVATHNLELAREMDRTLTIRNGQIEEFQPTGVAG